MSFGKKLIFALTITITISSMPTFGRSLYVITDHTPNGTFTAYDINDEQTKELVIWQEGEDGWLRFTEMIEDWIEELKAQIQE